MIISYCYDVTNIYEAVRYDILSQLKQLSEIDDHD